MYLKLSAITSSLLILYFSPRQSTWAHLPQLLEPSHCAHSFPSRPEYSKLLFKYICTQHSQYCLKSYALLHASHNHLLCPIIVRRFHPNLLARLGRILVQHLLPHLGACLAKSSSTARMSIETQISVFNLSSRRNFLGTVLRRNGTELAVTFISSLGLKIMENFTLCFCVELDFHLVYAER